MPEQKDAMEVIKLSNVTMDRCISYFIGLAQKKGDKKMKWRKDPNRRFDLEDNPWTWNPSMKTVDANGSCASVSLRQTLSEKGAVSTLYWAVEKSTMRTCVLCQKGKNSS